MFGTIHSALLRAPLLKGQHSQIGLQTPNAVPPAHLPSEVHACLQHGSVLQKLSKTTATWPLQLDCELRVRAKPRYGFGSSVQWPLRVEPRTGYTRRVHVHAYQSTCVRVLHCWIHTPASGRTYANCEDTEVKSIGADFVMLCPHRVQLVTVVRGEGLPSSSRRQRTSDLLSNSAVSQVCRTHHCGFQALRLVATEDFRSVILSRLALLPPKPHQLSTAALPSGR